MSETSVQVRIRVDWEAAERHGRRMLAGGFLGRFQSEGENWQREIAGDPMLREFVRVEVEVVNGD